MHSESILTEVIPFEKQDKKFVESIASQAAIVIGNAKPYKFSLKDSSLLA